MNILLAAILLTNVVFLAIFCVVLLRARRFYGDFNEKLKSYFLPGKDTDGKDTPSQFAELVSVISDTVARSIMAQAKATLMGKLSGEARADAAAETEIAEAALAQSNPLLAGIASLLPKKFKTNLLRNPGLIDAVTRKFGQNSVVNTAPSNGHGSQINFKL